MQCSSAVFCVLAGELVKLSVHEMQRRLCRLVAYLFQRPNASVCPWSL
jgi:hypothetical protein